MHAAQRAKGTRIGSPRTRVAARRLEHAQFTDAATHREDFAAGSFSAGELPVWGRAPAQARRARQRRLAGSTKRMPSLRLLPVRGVEAARQEMVGWRPTPCAPVFRGADT